MRKIKILLFIVISIVCNTSFIYLEKNNICGLYKNSLHIINYADFLLIEKRGIIKFGQVAIQSNQYAEKDIKKNGVSAKYQIKGDSIFFKYDSIYGGKSKTTFTAFGKYQEIYNNQYHKVPTIYAGHIKDDTISFKIIEHWPATLTNPDGIVITYGKSDTIRIYYEDFVRCK